MAAPRVTSAAAPAAPAAPAARAAPAAASPAAAATTSHPSRARALSSGPRSSGRCSGRRQDVKGKPVARRGRKARGLATVRDSPVADVTNREESIVTISMNLKMTLAGAAAVLAFAVAPTAQAKQSPLPDGTYVCNTAHSGSDGVLELVDPAEAFVHTDTGLTAMRNGNANAAAHSRALALCTVDPFNGGSGIY